MKTVIEILSIEKIGNKILSDVKFIDGDTMLKDDEFKDDELTFKIKNVGILESSKEIYPLIIEFTSEINDLSVLVGKQFFKIDVTIE